MTRKETLYTERHELQNQLRALRGEETHPMLDGWRLRQALDDERVLFIQKDIEDLHKAITKQEAENARKARAEEFYSTPEGQAYKASLKAQLQDVYKVQEANMESQLNYLNKTIRAALGERWAVKNLSEVGVDFGRLKEDGTDYIFGQTIEIRAEQDYFGKRERFETNIGTTGGFDLESEDTDSRRQFYIDLGNLLTQTDTLASIKQSIFNYHDRMETNRETGRSLQAKLNNPLGI